MILGNGGASDKNYRAAESSVIKRSDIGDGSTIDKDTLVIMSKIGRHVDIEKRNLIQSASIGDMTYTGEDTSIMWADIGKYCCISRMVDIGGNEHNYKAASMMPEYRLKNKLGGVMSKHPDEDRVTVGNDVWIGQGVSIVRKPGLKIGDGAVLGSGAVITKDVPPYAVMAGVPAKVIRYRFSEDVIERLLKIKWWDWDEKTILENKDSLMGDLDDEKLELLEKAALIR